MKQFSSDFTGPLTETLARCFREVEVRPYRLLEIGCFEGRGTLLLLNHFCKHVDSAIDCVDPWDDSYVRSRQEFNEWNPLFVGQYERFAFNTRDYRAKIRTYRDVSTNVLPGLVDEYDLVYIDGDHHPDQVYQDALMAFRVTKRGGFILFDDYLWEHKGIGPKAGADRFLKEFQSCLEVVYSAAQLLVRIRETWSDPLLVRTTQVAGLPSLLLETWGASDAISGPLFRGQAWEPKAALLIARFFSEHRNAAFVDLGANIGIHSILALKAGARHAYSIECHPASVQKLTRNLALNCCASAATVVPLAASDSTGRVVELRHVGVNVGASFIDNPASRFLPLSTGSFSCRTVRFDDLSFSNSLASFDALFLKIDIEGEELRALKGMERFLASDRVGKLLLELNPYTSDRSSLREVLGFLSVRGWNQADVAFSVPPDAWHGDALPLGERQAARKITGAEIDRLLDQDAILEVVFSR